MYISWFKLKKNYNMCHCNNFDYFCIQYWWNQINCHCPCVVIRIHFEIYVYVSYVTFPLKVTHLRPLVVILSKVKVSDSVLNMAFFQRELDRRTIFGKLILIQNMQLIILHYLWPFKVMQHNLQKVVF